LKDWLLKWSNDGRWWTIRDTQANSRGLDKSHRTAVFTLNHSDIILWIRLRQTGRNCGGGDDLPLSAFELASRPPFAQAKNDKGMIWVIRKHSHGQRSQVDKDWP
jgi:hypothetical protein